MTVQHLNHQGSQLAYRRADGRGPTIIWCGGLASDMDGSKAVFLHEACANAGQNFVRFDYFGHGISDGDFIDGSISRWASDVVAVIDAFGTDGVILVGSSMGGWASLLAATQRPDTVRAMVLINPAPDFTERMYRDEWTDALRATLERDGLVEIPSGYEEPYRFTKAFIDDGRANQLLPGPIPVTCPVDILQGADDPTVRPEHSRVLVDALASEHVGYTLVKGGDHSLSREADLERLWHTLQGALTKA